MGFWYTMANVQLAGASEEVRPPHKIPVAARREIMTHARRLAGAAALCALLALALAAQAGSYNLRRAVTIPELGIANYQGVENVRLHDAAYINTPWTEEALFVGDSGNDADNRSLVGFDLSALAGWQATGDATLRLRITHVDPDVAAVDTNDYFDLYKLHSTNAGWAEGQSTWNRLDHAGDVKWKNADGTDRPLGASPGGGLGAPGDGYQATPLDTVNQAAYAADTYVTFVIPQAEVQAMIDGDNPGLLLRTRDETETGRLAFRNRSGNAEGPRLTVHAVQTNPYVDAVLADTPIGYYRLDELTSAEAGNNGTSGTAGLGTYVNQGNVTQGQPGPSPATGQVGLNAGNVAPIFPGSGSARVEIPAAVLPTGTDARTFEGWFNGTDGTLQNFLTYGVDSTGQRVSISAGPDRLAVAVSGHNYGINNLGAGPGWHHVAVVFPDAATKSNQWQLFVDGVNRSADAGTIAGGTVTVNTQPGVGKIGANVGGGIDEVAVYDTALASYEIQRHVNRAYGKRDFLFTTASDNGQSPATSGAAGLPTGTELFVRERGNETDPQLEVQAFLQFDLSDLAGVVPEKVYLTLHQNHKLNTNSENMYLGQVADPWDLVNTPAFDQAIVGTEILIGENGPGGASTAKDYKIDVTDIVRDWLRDPASNHGFRLRIDDDYVAAAFDHVGPLAPDLEVVVPEPATMALLGLAATGLGAYLRKRRTL
jgi:hypothetical protein